MNVNSNDVTNTRLKSLSKIFRCDNCYHFDNLFDSELTPVVSNTIRIQTVEGNYYDLKSEIVSIYDETYLKTLFMNIYLQNYLNVTLIEHLFMCSDHLFVLSNPSEIVETLTDSEINQLVEKLADRFYLGSIKEIRRIDDILIPILVMDSVIITENGFYSAIDVEYLLDIDRKDFKLANQTILYEYNNVKGNREN